MGGEKEERQNRQAPEGVIKADCGKDAIGMGMEKMSFMRQEEQRQEDGRKKGLRVKKGGRISRNVVEKKDAKKE